MNGLDYLRSAIFATKTNFSRLPNFLRYIETEFINLPFNYEPVLEKIQWLMAQTRPLSEISGVDDILKILIAEDLGRIKQSMISNRQVIESDVNFSESLTNCRDECVRLLRDIGLAIEPPNIYIVESFPSPFERTSFAAMAPDAFDEKNYGIPRGLYFRKDLLLPIYSRFLFVHEIIHAVLGQLNPEYMGRGLEEGLAEIVGGLYLGNWILSKEIIRTTFYHNRLGYGINQFWQLYLDYMRMGTYLYNRFGLDGLIFIIQSGRGKIKEIEKLCFQGKFGEISIPAGRWVEDVTDLISYITLTFSRDFVVSPLAYYLANYIVAGDTINSLSEKTKLSKELVEKSLMELQDRVFILLHSKGRVDISDAQLLLSANAIRYEV